MALPWAPLGRCRRPSGQHPDVTFLRPDIPPTVKVVIDKALQKGPDGRFQTGTEFANALRLALGVRKRTPA